MAVENVSAAATQLPIRQNWLDLRVEDIIEPATPIVDPHHHLWDLPGRRYLFDEFLGDINSGHNICATVFAQCHSMYRADGPEELRCVGETQFVAGVAAQSESGAYGTARVCAGIVGSLDLSLGERAAPVLEAHIAAGGGRFRGIRGRTAAHQDSSIHKLPTPLHVLVDPSTRTTIGLLRRYGLTLDIWAYHTQMQEVIDVCRSFPDLQIIINHVGGPIGIGPFEGKRGDVFKGWEQDIRTLASFPNTLMKVGGMAMRFTGFDFYKHGQPPSSEQLSQAWRPYFTTCVESFTPARCMFESNFPVDKAMCSYPVLWNAFKRLAAGFSPAERTALFSGTAARAYRLNIEQA
jgi:L-fuconolactonase